MEQVWTMILPTMVSIIFTILYNKYIKHKENIDKIEYELYHPLLAIYCLYGSKTEPNYPFYKIKETHQKQILKILGNSIPYIMSDEKLYNLVQETIIYNHLRDDERNVSGSIEVALQQLSDSFNKLIQYCIENQKKNSKKYIKRYK